MVLKGIPASRGMAEGRAFVYAAPELRFEAEAAEDAPGELRRLGDAAAAAIDELIALKEAVRGRMGDDFAHIFRSQQTIAEDESLRAEVEQRIRDEHESAEAAVYRVFEDCAALFDELEDSDYNKERVSDIRDVQERIMRRLLGIPEANLAVLPPRSIVAAENLLPSDTALMDVQRVAGIVTTKGGAVSHAAILANNLGIPAAVGVRGLMESVESGNRILLDAAGESGLVTVNPDPGAYRDFTRRLDAMSRRDERLRDERDLPALTADGAAVRLGANVGSDAELEAARGFGAKCIGLYRSEFLFMNKAALPGEDEQYADYRRAAEGFDEVIIRTLDVGGDKTLPGFRPAKEENPFLGNRGIRLTLFRPEVFITQLKAVLRAGVHGNVKVMYPMVGGVPELDAASALMDEAKGRLEGEGLPYDASMEVGVMVEVPSAVWAADALARRVDFFSIGTNDLTQYMLAADRLNSDVADYYRVFDPSIFRAVEAVVRAAEAHRRWVGVCGELGGNPLAIPLLLGLGVKELSMSARALPEAGELIRRFGMDELRKLAERVLDLESDDDIRGVLREFNRLSQFSQSNQSKE